MTGEGRKKDKHEGGKHKQAFKKNGLTSCLKSQCQVHERTTKTRKTNDLITTHLFTSQNIHFSPTKGLSANLPLHIRNRISTPDDFNHI